MTEEAKTPKSYGKLAKVGLAWGLVRQWTTSLLLLPASMVLARLLTPEEAGIAAAAQFFMQLGARLTQFGFGASLVRHKNVTPDHVSSVFVMNLVLGTTAWGALTLTAPWVGAFFRSPDAAAILPTAALGFLIMAFGSVPTALLSRDMRYRESATSEWIATVIEAVASIALAWNGFSYWSLVYGRLLGDGSRVACRMWMTRWQPSLRFSRAAAHDMLSFGAGIYAKNLLEYGSQNLDNLVVGRVLGVGALGFYDKAFSLMNKFVARINIAGPSVSFRVFSIIHEETERFRRAYKKVILSVTLVGFPIMTGMLMTAPELIEVLFGARWLPAAGPFRILCLVGMLRLLNTYASSATQAKGQIWFEVKRHLMFVAVLVTAVVLFSRWGITGVAFGVLIATVVMTVMLQTLVRRIAGLSWHDMLTPQIPAVVCSAGLIIVLMLTRASVYAALEQAPAWGVLLASVASGSIYFLGFLLLARFSAVRELVNETAHDLAPRFAKQLPWLKPPAKGVPALSGPVS